MQEFEIAKYGGNHKVIKENHNHITIASVGQNYKYIALNIIKFAEPMAKYSYIGRRKLEADKLL